MALEGNELEEVMKSLPNWSYEREESRSIIKRSLIFQDFKKAFAFMTRTAEYADGVDHHPEWFNVYNRVDITLSTHTDHAVTQKDIDLARKIEEFSKTE